MWHKTWEANRIFLRLFNFELRLLLLFDEILEIQLEFKDFIVRWWLTTLFLLVLISLSASLLHHFSTIFFDYFSLFNALSLLSHRLIPFPSCLWLLIMWSGWTETLIRVFFGKWKSMIEILTFNCLLFLSLILTHSTLLRDRWQHHSVT